MGKIFVVLLLLSVGISSCAEYNSVVTGYYKEIKTDHILFQQNKAQVIRDEICNMPWFIIQDDARWATVIEIMCMGSAPVSSKDLLNMVKGSGK
jgi:hypothetical protein